MLIYAKWIGIGLLVLLAVTFTVKNSQEVTLSYFFMGPISMPLYALIFVSLCAGIIIGIVFSLFTRRHKENSKDMQQYRRQLASDEPKHRTSAGNKL
jgi:uncharacterized integral membrane protein